MRHSLRVFLWALFLVSASVPAWAATGRCTVAERKSADQQLWLNVRDQQASIMNHLPWGEPTESVAAFPERLLIQRDYVIRYDDDLKIPVFTAERVDASRFKKKIPRTDCFRPDPRIPTPLASKPKDYEEPIFDQGHLAAFADQATSVIAGNNSFVMSNMAPQTCQFNRGIWQILEGIVRVWVAERKTVYVISGSIMDRDADGVRDEDNLAARMNANNHTNLVAIPTAFYKIVSSQNTDGTVETLTIVLPHNQANPDRNDALAYLQNHITTVGDIEHRTGLGFFPQHPVIHEAITLWPFDQSKMPNSLCHAVPDPAFEQIWQH